MTSSQENRNYFFSRKIFEKLFDYWPIRNYEYPEMSWKSFRQIRANRTFIERLSRKSASSVCVCCSITCFFAGFSRSADFFGAMIEMSGDIPNWSAILCLVGYRTGSGTVFIGPWLTIATSMMGSGCWISWTSGFSSSSFKTLDDFNQIILVIIFQEFQDRRFVSFFSGNS